jgi:hypothetical protein
MLKIETNANKQNYLPGEEIQGTITWSLESSPNALELRLFWFTQGKGIQDVAVANSLRFDTLGNQGHREFRVKFPEAPYSFAGKLIALNWALELIAEPSGENARLELVMSPEREQILLYY